MPNRPSSIRDLRLSRARAARNRAVRARLGSLLRRYRQRLTKRDAAGTAAAVAAAVAALDRAVRAGVIKAAHAARRKSRLMAALNRLGRGFPPPAGSRASPGGPGRS